MGNGLLGWHERDLVERGELSGRQTVANARLRTGTHFIPVTPPAVPRPVPPYDPPLPIAIRPDQSIVIQPQRIEVRPRDAREREQRATETLLAVALVVSIAVGLIILAGGILAIINALREVTT